MEPLDANPLGILMPRGTDIMVDPPPVASHSRQSDLFRRTPTSHHVPSDLIASLALETIRTYPDYPTDCITSAHMGDSYLFFSAAGPSRSLIATCQIPIATAAGTLEQHSAPSSLADLAAANYKPLYTRAAAPILQLVLNQSCPAGWQRSLHYPDLPILAARSSSRVQFHQLSQPQNSSTSTQWTLSESPLAVLDCPGSEDLTWSRHMTQNCAIITNTGAVLEVSLDPERLGSSNGAMRSSKRANTGNNINAKEVWRPSGKLLSELPFLQEQQQERMHAVLRCTYTSLHPRQMVVSLHNRIGLIDLRLSSSSSSNFQQIFSCAATGGGASAATQQWISAIVAGENDDSTSGNGSSTLIHYVAASTATEVLLFDLRRPQAILARWEHGMTHSPATTSTSGSNKLFKRGNTSTGSISGGIGANAVRHAPPSKLIWLPSEAVGSVGGMNQQNAAAAQGPPLVERRLLAVNAGAGKGVVCTWKEERTRGGIAVMESGGIVECCTEESGNSTNRRHIDLGANGEAPLFEFEPTWWTKIDAQQPVQLLFDVRGSEYPVELAEAVEQGRKCQMQRAAAVEFSAKPSASAADGADDANANGTSKKKVWLLPSSWKAPVSLGIAAISERDPWKKDLAPNRGTSREKESVVLAMLSPTQEIVLAEIKQRTQQQQEGNDGSSSGGGGSGRPSTTAVRIILPKEEESNGEGTVGDPMQLDGEEEVIEVDAQGRIIPDAQKALAEEAAGTRAAAVAAAAAVSFPQPKMMKLPAAVHLPLHRVYLEEVLRQYTMDPQQYNSTFLNLNQTPSVDEISAMVASAQVPFTASEGWAALIAGPELDKRKFLQGTTPAVSSRRKKEPGSNAAKSDTHLSRFKAALSRVGILPIPQGQRPGDPNLDLKNAFPDVPKAPLFPTIAFERNLQEAVAPPDAGPSTSRQPPGAQQRGVLSSVLKYPIPESGPRTRQGGVGSGSDVRMPSVGQLVTADKAVGGDKVFVASSKASEMDRNRNVPVLEMKPVGKQPSAQVRR